jgi:hypothetical protein
MVKLVQSSSKILTYNITSIPTGTEIEEAYLTIKESPSVVDALADVFKTVTVNLSSDGQITDTGADTIAKVEFYLSPEDTAGLDTTQYYFIAVKLKLDNAEFYLVEESIEGCRVREFGIERI